MPLVPPPLVWTRQATRGVVDERLKALGTARIGTAIQ